MGKTRALLQITDRDIILILKQDRRIAWSLSDAIKKYGCAEAIFCFCIAPRLRTKLPTSEEIPLVTYAFNTGSQDQAEELVDKITEVLTNNGHII